MEQVETIVQKLALLLVDFEKMFNKMIWFSTFHLRLPIFSMKANGELGDSFYSFRSIKQGYPLLHYLL
jgi:hypothetical protein